MGYIINKFAGKDKAEQFQFILNTIVFGVTAVSYLDEGLYLIAIALLLIAIFNFIFFALVKLHRYQAKFIFSMLNVVSSLLVSWGYFQTDSKYVKYIWLGIALMNLIIGITFRFKFKKENRVSPADPSENEDDAQHLVS